MFLAPLFRLLPGNWKSIEARDVARAMLAEALAPGHEGGFDPDLFRATRKGQIKCRMALAFI